MILMKMEELFMKPALEKFLIIAGTLAAIGIFVFIALWASMKDKKGQMDDLFNNTNVPSSFVVQPVDEQPMERA
jgi:FtsZ-interacting cell division protein ZipA